MDYYQIQIPNLLGVLVDDLKIKKGAVDSEGLKDFVVKFSTIVGVMVVGRVGMETLGNRDQ